jgi:pre-60S factor REI1
VEKEVTEEEEITQTIEERIAAARSRLKTTDCLFCPASAPSLEENLTHMSHTHSFFVPDAEYLVDLPGLITYLGEKLAVGNVCLYCNGKGRELRSLEAVRKHMLDKSHCKIAYDSERDQLEISDYYDFTSSYPEPLPKSKGNEESEEWEDVDSDEDDEEIVDEVISIDETASSPDTSDSDSESEDDLPPSQITYGDSHLELVLPSGARIGHRSMRRYYAQTFHGAREARTEDPNSGAALVRRLIADKNSALVPRRGGFGAFGSGTDVVKARNAGEARHATGIVKQFKEQRRREDFRTKTGFIKNNQKFFKDPNMPVS